jgi:hypothetical protein
MSTEETAPLIDNVEVTPPQEDDLSDIPESVRNVSLQAVKS